MAAWTGFPLWFYVAAAGLLIGGFIGLIGASSAGSEAPGIFTELGLTNAGGLFGAIVGALIGLLAGFFALAFLLIIHPLNLASAVVTGAVVTYLIVAIRLRIELKTANIRGYRKASRRELARINVLMGDVAQRMSLAVVPEVWISEQLKPAAWAHGRYIVLTRGLLGDYDDSEAPPQSDFDDFALRAMIAHELTHWNEADAVGNMLLSSAFAPIVVVVNAINWVRLRAEWAGLLLWFVFWPAWICSRCLIGPLAGKQSRQQEFRADAVAASLGEDYRLGLRRALSNLAPWEPPRTGWQTILDATHPSIEHRLERLEAHRELPTPPPPTPEARPREVILVPPDPDPEPALPVVVEAEAPAAEPELAPRRSIQTLKQLQHAAPEPEPEPELQPQTFMDNLKPIQTLKDRQHPMTPGAPIPEDIVEMLKLLAETRPVEDVELRRQMIDNEPEAAWYVIEMLRELWTEGIPAALGITRDQLDLWLGEWEEGNTTCPICEGRGWMPGMDGAQDPTRCRNCDSKGRIARPEPKETP